MRRYSTCERCGQRFLTYPCRIANGNDRFCSRRCWLAPTTLRPHPDDSSAMLVPLGDGVLAVIDAADAEVVSRYRWHAATRGGRVYAAGRLAFAGSDTDKVYLHRLIAQPAKGVEVDHRDGDGLNFRRVNLRHATRGQNAQNTKRRTDNRSGYKGVRMSRRGDRWTARVQGVHIGTFDTAETAALAYDEEARRRFGVFAQTNFTEQD